MSSIQYTLKELYQTAIERNYIGSDISYKKFSEVVRDFNIQVSDKIISNHYKFKFGLGTIQVLRKDRKGKSIDWHTSKKVRQDIIDRGEIPFNKVTAPTGIEWFVYFEGKDIFKWHWYKDKGTEFIKNSKYYLFQAMTANKKRVGKVIKANQFADLDYGLHK